MQFTRDDWTLFMSLGTLPQKAGAPLRNLACLVVKELVDNALDVGANVEVSLDLGWIVIEDDGPGISLDQVPVLFSVNRPLTSSKMIRMPQRGALGNGLRVVMGAIYASGGEIVVATRGARLALTVQDDGTTKAEMLGASDRKGTRVMLKLGSSIPQVDADHTLFWGKMAAAYARVTEKEYKLGKTSPWWYDGEAFFAMCRAGNHHPFRDLCLQFHNVRPGVADDVAGSYLCSEVSKVMAFEALQKLRVYSFEIKPITLGYVGALSETHYSRQTGTIDHGQEPVAKLPYVIEVWAHDDGPRVKGKDADSITVMVNRTPVTGEFYMYRTEETKTVIRGSGLNHYFKVPKSSNVSILVNVTTPYMPITTDGKDPDLKRYLEPLNKAIEAAAAKCKRAVVRNVREETMSQRDYIERCLDDAIGEAGSHGRYRFSLRQLFYAVRPYLLRAGMSLDYNYFSSVVTQIEERQGRDIPQMYRSVRGVLYQPHVKVDVPLGTMNIEKYERPKLTFNKILYIEKEGFFPLLKDEGWPERHDCALMTCQGFASRAARDLIDLLGDTEEDIWFYCLHDADASGTMIFQSLVEETRARGARRVHVKNLGLDVEEALEMGLQVEEFTKKRAGKLPVADYAWRNEQWLQTQRVELNAMSSELFLDWLTEKFNNEEGKIVPEEKVLKSTYVEKAEEALREALTEKILKEAGLDDQVAALVADLDTSTAFHGFVDGWLQDTPEDRWDAPIVGFAKEMAKKTVFGESTS